MAETFIFRTKWAKVVSSFDPSTRLEIYEAIFEFVEHGTQSKLSPVSTGVMAFLMPEITDSLERYAKQCEINRENGKKGGRPKKETEKTENNPSVFEKPIATEKSENNNSNNNNKVNSDNNSSVTVLKEQPKKLNEPLNEIELAGTAEFVFRMTKKEIASSEIESYWQAFLLATEGELYVGRNKQVTHFRNWLRNQFNKPQALKRQTVAEKWDEWEKRKGIKS